MRVKVQNRKDKLAKVEETFGRDSIQYTFNQEKLKIAEKQYDATKEGIQKIEEAITKTDYDEDLMHRYKESRLTNKIQTLSVKEVKNGRQEKIARLGSTAFQLDPNESYSVLESARIFQEYKVIDHLAAHQLEPVKPETWNAYVNKLSEQVPSNPEGKAILKELKDTPPPPNYIFAGYVNFDKLAQISQKHKQSQQKMIADYLGADLSVIQAKHKQLREAYLSQEKPPNIPEHWVRGESHVSGIMNNPRFRYAPADPASNYANYSLMYNVDVLPDYQRRANSFVSLEQTDGTVSVSRYSPSGKLLYKESYDKINTNSMAQISQEIEGSTLITEKPSQKGISLEEVALQYLDLPSYNKDNVRAALKSDSDDVVELFLKTMSSSKKVWNSRSDRKTSLV